MGAGLEYIIEGECGHCGTRSEVGVAYGVTESQAIEVFRRFNPEYSHLRLTAFPSGSSGEKKE